MQNVYIWENGCTFAKFVVLAWAKKWLYFGELVVFGLNGVFGQNGCILGKIVVLARAKSFLYILGPSEAIWTGFSFQSFSHKEMKIPSKSPLMALENVQE